MPDLVVIKHPTLPIERSVSKDALGAWLAAGWVPLLDGQMARFEQLELDSMTVPQLRSYADLHDVDLSGARLKADILAAIAAALDSDAATAADQGQHSDEGDH